MNIVLWILQILLAALFLWHGWFFASPPAAMAEMLNSFLNPGFRTFIGVAEVLGALGLLLPGLTHTWPRLTHWRRWAC